MSLPVTTNMPDAKCLTPARILPPSTASAAQNGLSCSLLQSGQQSVQSAPQGRMQQPEQATPLHVPSMPEANQQLQPSSALVPWCAQHAPEAQRLRFATAQPSSSVDVPISTPPVSEAMQRRSSQAQQSTRVAAVMARHDTAEAAQFTPHESAGTVNNGNEPFDSTSPAQTSAGMARAHTATRRSSSDVGRNPFQLATTSTGSQRGATSAGTGAGVSPFQQALKRAASHESGYNRPTNQVSTNSSIGQTQQAPGVQIWPEHAVPALVTPGRSEQQQHRQDSMPVNHYIDISALTAAQASNHTPPTGPSNTYQQRPYPQQSMNSNGLITAQSASRVELAQQVPFYESSPQYTAVQAPVNRSLPGKAFGIAKGYLNIRPTRPQVQQNSDRLDGTGSNSPSPDLESAVPPSGCSPKSALLRSAIFPGGQGGMGGSPIPPEQAERRARGLVRTRVEPKVFFANERTFLQWLQISVLLMFTGLSLLGGSSVGSMGGGGSEGACGQNGGTACKASKVEWTPMC